MCLPQSFSSFKCQCTIYYSQAWSLVWDESPLFEEDIQAWANGPVVQVLYSYHQGQFNDATYKMIASHHHKKRSPN